MDEKEIKKIAFNRAIVEIEVAFDRQEFDVIRM